jgi:hypothetical protein
MFSKTDFWIGLAVGAVAGIFGYKMLSERASAVPQLPQPAPQQAAPDLNELMAQKERLEDLIAEQQAAQ